jgi:glycosyltransferase involved in cell wall biosynthesis
VEGQVALPRVLISAAFSSNPGGVERVVGNLHKQLLQQGFQVDTLIAQSGTAAAVQRFMDVPAVEEASLLPTTNRLRYIANLRHLYLRYAPDAIIIPASGQTVPICQLIAATAAKVPLRIVIFESDRSIVVRERIINTFTWPLLSRAVAISRHMKTSLTRTGVPARKISVIYNGVDVPTAGLSKPAARNGLGVPLDSFVVAVVSRLVRMKRVDCVIDAVSILKSQRSPPVHVLIAGDGPALSDLQDQAARAGLAEHVHFFGWMPDPSAIYAAADIVALPSDYEGLALIIAEGAMYSRGSIVTDVGGNSEFVVDGKTGFLIGATPNRSAEMVAIIQRCIDEPAMVSLLGANAHRISMEELTVGRMGAAYARMISERRLRNANPSPAR